MSRSLSGGVIAEIGAQVLRPCLLIKLEFDGGDVCVNSTDRLINWGGDDYMGAGNVGRVGEIMETAELRAAGVSLELSGIPVAYIAIALGEPYQGRPATIRAAFFNEAYQIIADPVIVFQGFMDQMDISIGGTATIRMTCEHRMVRWEAPNIRRFTNEDQQERYPGDEGLEFVEQTAEREIYWGQATPAPAL